MKIGALGLDCREYKSCTVMDFNKFLIQQSHITNYKTRKRFRWHEVAQSVLMKNVKF